MAPFPQVQQPSNSSSEHSGIRPTTIFKRKISAFSQHGFIAKLQEYKRSFSNYINNSVFLRYIRNFCDYLLHSNSITNNDTAMHISRSNTRLAGEELQQTLARHLEETAAQYCAVCLNNSLIIRANTEEQHNESMDNLPVAEEQVMSQQNNITRSKEDVRDLTVNIKPMMNVTM